MSADKQRLEDMGNSGEYLSSEFLEPTVASIISTQVGDGSVPDLEGGIVEPWTHVECAMAIDVGDFHGEAEKAYEWLANMQMEDGSWYANYQHGKPKDKYKVSHASSYIAVGVWHHYLVTGNKAFVERMWPCVRSAIDFVLGMRGPNGEVYWARDIEGKICTDYQITSCSSTYLSIKNAVNMAELLGKEHHRWTEAGDQLRQAILKMPLPIVEEEINDVFAMDWYYPALCSVINGREAVDRIYTSWDKFIVHGKGTVCNLKKQWVTAAETSELAIALAAQGEYEMSAMLYNWIHHLRDEDGAYWYGVAYPENEIWPLEKPTWTAAAVVLAADMLRPKSPTNLLLDHNGSVLL
ncbi:MAG: hypothetical protein PHO26_10920 [Dehalococcoidia bacterium]|nr:hypothetical protein [Dehalococcoidia bacterium]MDD5493154.1 hypothetical protein [Dehalococcoidia bacterium]